MVLTRYQLANSNKLSQEGNSGTKFIKPRTALTSTNTIHGTDNVLTDFSDAQEQRNENDLVKDPPLLTISRTQSFIEEEEDVRNDPILKIDSLLEQLDDYECSTLDALMARWPSIHTRLKGMRPHLPPKKNDNEPTLVLDLDETLIHTYRSKTADNGSGIEADYMVFAENGYSCLLAGKLRPGVFEFLSWAAKSFEIVVWTAGREDYASMARHCLDPEGVLIRHMLSRNSCIRMKSAKTKEIMYIKDLCALGRDLSKTFLVDNTPHAASLNLSNLIPIEAYFGGGSDNELMELRKFLESSLVRLKDRKDDMRIILHRQFNLKRKLRERVGSWKQQQEMLKLRQQEITGENEDKENSNCWPFPEETIRLL